MTDARTAQELETVIRVRGLTVGFGDRLILKGLDLDLQKGEILGVVGASGSGKSVLARTILDLIPKRNGTIEMLGCVLDEMPKDQRRALQRRIGVLFQFGALFSSLTVKENIQLPMREHLDLSDALLDEVAGIKLDMVGLPPDAGEKLPAELSGGMTKRAALARALALDPEILFLDEPTSGLDPIGAAGFDALIATLRDTLGLTVFMVTHDLASLAGVCDRIVAIAEGRIVAAGSYQEMVDSPQPWVRAYFGGERGRGAHRQALKGHDLRDGRQVP
jgi:phospholipid/cholesterol/gamma-HCH transport system ATP-binding protein